MVNTYYIQCIYMEDEGGQDYCRECQDGPLSIIDCDDCVLFGVSEFMIVLWITGLHSSRTSYQIENPDKLRSSTTCWDMS